MRNGSFFFPFFSSLHHFFQKPEKFQWKSENPDTMSEPEKFRKTWKGWQLCLTLLTWHPVWLRDPSISSLGWIGSTVQKIQNKWSFLKITVGDHMWTKCTTVVCYLRCMKSLTDKFKNARASMQNRTLSAFRPIAIVVGVQLHYTKHKHSKYKQNQHKQP